MSSAIARQTRIGPCMLMLISAIGAQYIGWPLVLQILLISCVGLLPLWGLMREFDDEDEEGDFDEALDDAR